MYMSWSLNYFISNTLRNANSSWIVFFLQSWFQWICWATPGPVPLQIRMSGHTPQQADQALPQQEDHRNYLGNTNFSSYG